MSPSPQLTVLVVGDTLDALICAAAFHSHGHHVYLFSSEDYSSSSATVQITPNAHDALSRLGISIPPDASMTVCSATGFSGSLEKFGRMCMDNDGSVWERVSDKKASIKRKKANGHSLGLSLKKVVFDKYFWNRSHQTRIEIRESKYINIPSKIWIWMPQECRSMTERTSLETSSSVRMVAAQTFEPR